jgi:hypothetical protein
LLTHQQEQLFNPSETVEAKKVGAGENLLWKKIFKHCVNNGSNLTPLSQKTTFEN